MPRSAIHELAASSIAMAFTLLRGLAILSQPENKESKGFDFNKYVFFNYKETRTGCNCSLTLDIYSLILNAWIISFLYIITLQLHDVFVDMPWVYISHNMRGLEGPAVSFVLTPFFDISHNRTVNLTLPTLTCSLLICAS